MNTPYKLVAFDMFGTLVRNDISDWHRTVCSIAIEQSLPVPPDSLWEEWHSREVNFRKTRTNMSDPESSPRFRSYWEAWRDTFVETFDSLKVDADADLAATRCIEALICQPAFPDATGALEATSKICSTAVLSNADDLYLNGTIECNDWLFDVVLSSETLRAYKPDPRIFAGLLAKTGIPPQCVLYVGDSAYDDAHGAKLAGMHTVLVERDQNTPGRTPPPGTLSLLDPDFVIGDLSELPAIVRIGIEG